MARSPIRRIAIVTHEFAPFRGGIGRVAEGLADGAAASGWEPVVVAPDYGADHRSEDGSRPYRVHRFRGTHCSMVSPRRLVRFARYLRRTLPELRPDLIHAVCPAAQMALAAPVGPGRLPAPFAYTVHGTELIRYRRELLPRLWMLGSFRRPVGIASVSRAVQGRLHARFSVPASRSFVSHPGIGDEWHRLGPTDREETRAGWGAGPDDFVVLTVARRVYEKGHDRVIRGIAALTPSERARTVYVVAGTGPESFARELEAAAGELGVRLRLLGKVSDRDLVAACDGADLFAMLSRETPTRLEGLGLTYVEAGSRGCPSIACDTGGVSEAVRDGETGLLLPQDPAPGDVAAALRRFLDDDAFRRRAGEAAREWARGFTHRRHAREVYTRLGELAAGG